MNKQLSFFEYENNFLSEFEIPCIWNSTDFTTIYFYGYGVNRRGQIRNNSTGKLLYGRTKPNKHIKTPYQRQNFTLDGKSYETLVHRIVACTFVKCLDRQVLTMVNHIDENKQNNHYTNLEWVTHSDNIKKWMANKDKDQLKLL